MAMDSWIWSFDKGRDLSKYGTTGATSLLPTLELWPRSRVSAWPMGMVTAMWTCWSGGVTANRPT